MMATITITPGWAGPASAVGTTPIVVQVAGVGPPGAAGTSGVAPSGTGIVTVTSGTLGTPGALTGDVTTTAGGLATTLATVNSNVGSFTNASVTVNAKGLVTAASSGAGGGGGDMLSTLTSAEISITGATTLTISRMHVCSGTSADYTVTLPAASGNAGKFIGVRMSPALTKFVTVDGSGSETIDGALTRIMWAGETAILLCDGSNWFKVAGRSIPMRCRMYRSTALSISNGVSAVVPLTATADDNTGAMADVMNERITVRRAANYLCAGAVVMSLSAAAPYCEAQLRRSGTFILSDARGLHAANFVAPAYSQTVAFTVGQYAALWAYQSSGSSASVYVSDPVTFLDLLEVPAW